jgi:catechol 2,3-dioxygenase-like lactoylglutathione lyase family enzyme
VGIELVTLLVHDYDPAVTFFVDALGFELVEDAPSVDTDGAAKRWVVVRPSGASVGLLLAKARGEDQVRLVGRQFAGRVGLFLRVDDLDKAVARMTRNAVRFLSDPRDELYGRVAVFEDVLGNRWDLLGPRP